jgi:hypothetical protein
MLISDNITLAGAEKDAAGSLKNMLDMLKAVADTLEGLPGKSAAETESGLRDLAGTMVNALRGALARKVREDDTLTINITAAMIEAMLSRSSSAANMLLLSAIERGSETSVYVVRAEDVNADKKSFMAMLGAMHNVNRALGRPAYKVVVVGDASELESDRTGTLAETVSESGLRSRIQALKESKEADKMVITGISRDQNDDLLKEICDIIIVTVEGSIFGRALFASLNYRSVTDRLIQSQREHLASLATDSEQGKKVLLLVSEFQNRETSETVDDFLHADLVADTAF